LSWKKHDYEDIPGTYVFDGKTAHSAFGLNKLLFSFNHAENRRAFADDPEGYAARFKLTDAQKEALLRGDYLELIRLGANIYYLAKVAIPAGVSVQDIGGAFRGITTDEFRQRLFDHAEGFEEKLGESGGFWNG
jgi:protocatechuate 4,5-dioxygenase alpha chain